MLSRHESHLRSTCQVLLQHLDEARQIITTGKTPGGGRVEPFPEPLRTRLREQLDLASAQIERTARSLSPEQVRISDLSAARMWVSILLRTCQDLLGDLRPERMAAQYGEISPEEAEPLREMVNEIAIGISEAVEVMDLPSR
jgi:hypothetical protein